MENENPNLLHAVLKQIQECIVVTFPIRLYDRCALRFNNPPTGIHYDKVISAQPGLNRAGSTDSQSRKLSRHASPNMGRSLVPARAKGFCQHSRQRV
jgi:hypothetical protein